MYPNSKHIDYLGLDAYMDNGNTWTNNFKLSVSDETGLDSSKPWMLAETGVNSSDSNYISQIDDLVSGTQSVFTGNNYAAALVYFKQTGYTMAPYHHRNGIRST